MPDITQNFLDLQGLTEYDAKNKELISSKMDEPETVTWEVWQTMSTSQKEGHIWLVTGAPDASSSDGVVDVLVNGISVVDEQGNANLTITMPDLENLSNVDVTSLANGQILKYNSTTQKWENANESGGGGGSTGLTVLSYGNSTWNDFITAHQTNSIVYCKASSGNNPASGTQGRLAFMAYLNSFSSPTEVEFQYYRSVSSHTDAQQGDQVFIYKLSKTDGWSYTTRNTFTKIAAGTNMTSSYSNGVLTLNSTASGGTTVVANPLGTASADLNKLQVGSSIYNIAGAVANPSGEATAELSKVQIGSTIYEIPTANLGNVDKIYLVQTLPGDAASHPNTLYLIEEV